MALTDVFRELPITNSKDPQQLALMMRWFVENFQRIALTSGSSTSDTSLDGTSGHHHTGVDGQGPPVSAVSNTCVTAGGSTVWHSGNDGAGTGLDADLLDGLHGSSYSTATGVVQATSATTIQARHTFNPTASTLSAFIMGSNAAGVVVTDFNADQVDGFSAGNSSGQVAVNNGTLCTLLNADQLDGSDSTLFVQSSASTSVRHASTEVDIGPIAASSIATFTVAISGSVGSTVSLGSPATIEAGLLWNGFVSLADTVTVRIYNSTAGAIDPASGTWNVTLIRRA